MYPFGTCTPRPSPISETPINSRNDSASTFTVGCRLTNPLIGSAANIMMPTASTTAATMTLTSSAIPTAVITESSEKTISSSMIWTITAAKEGATRADPWLLLAFQPIVDLDRRLGEQEQAAADQDEVASGDAAAEHGEERSGEADDPGNRQQQQDPHQHRRQQADPPRPRLLVVRQLARQNGDEDDVVDAEDHLEEGQRDEGEEAFGAEKRVHGPSR